MNYALDYIIDHKLGTEADYPYKGRDDKCSRKEAGERYGATEYTPIDPVDVNGLS